MNSSKFYHPGQLKLPLFKLGKHFTAQRPELISSEFFEASSFIQTWNLTNWEFIKPDLCIMLSLETLSTKNNTDLESAGNLQAFNKASSFTAQRPAGHHNFAVVETFLLYTIGWRDY